eukprot:11539951-Alexandrium_andersonii.AAC.1
MQSRVQRSAELGRAPRRWQPSLALRFGSAWIKTKAAVGQIQKPDGALARDTAESSDVLWQSRQPVWTAGWAKSAASESLLRAYGERGAPDLDGRKPSAADIGRAVLRAGASAPGVDGL